MLFLVPLNLLERIKGKWGMMANGLMLTQREFTLHYGDLDATLSQGPALP